MVSDLFGSYLPVSINTRLVKNECAAAHQLLTGIV